MPPSLSWPLHRRACVREGRFSLGGLLCGSTGAGGAAPPKIAGCRQHRRRGSRRPLPALQWLQFEDVAALQQQIATLHETFKSSKQVIDKLTAQRDEEAAINRKHTQ